MAIAYGNVLGFPFLARMGSPRITGEECLVVGLPSVPILTSLVAFMSLIREEFVLQWMLLAVMVPIGGDPIGGDPYWRALLKG